MALKLIPIFFAGILFLMSCKKKDDEVVVQPPSTIDINSYRGEAQSIYYEMLLEDTTHILRNQVALNQTGIEETFAMLKSIYDLNSSRSREVFEQEKIHHSSCYGFSSIYISVDPQINGMDKLLKGEIPTGNTDLDQFLAKYNIRFVQNNSYTSLFNSIELETAEDVNLIPVVAEMEQLEGIRWAEFNQYCIGAAQFIDMEEHDDYFTFTFTTGWGDCPSGCIHNKVWEFRVEEDRAYFVNYSER